MGLFSKKSFVGLDLGHHSLKAVQLEKSPGGWRVARVASMPTPPDAIKDGVVTDSLSLTAAIRALLKENHINATSAHIAVSGGSVVVRQVRMPRMAEATLRKSIKFEASRYVPSSVEESYVEFEIVGPADDNQMDVLMVAAPREIVESRVQACEAAGLQVESVDVEAFAIFRSLIEADELHDWSEKTLAIVNIGSSMTNMSVVTGGVFAMTRSIPNGGHTLTDALKSYFKLSYEDAESGKGQLDLRDLLDEAKPKENPPLRVLQQHLDDLVREVRRSLNYYQSQQTEGSQNKQQVDLVMLTGGGAKMLGMAEYIIHKLSIETVSSDVFSNPRFLVPGTSEAANGLELAVASGLAMRAHMKAA
jgi:type IV pilus assembly protein PilM